MRTRNGRLWIIIAVLVLVALWVASGALFRDSSEQKSQASEAPTHTTVAVRHSQAKPVERLLVLQGDVQPEQVVAVRAETAGQVAQWHVPRGAAVERGDLIAQIEIGERQSQLRQAQARVKVAEQQLRATRQLVEEGYEPEIQRDTAAAELEAAQADLAAIQQDINRTRIRAPIPGRVNQRVAEQGDFVAAGGEVAQIVNNHPLRAGVQVPQHRIEAVELGQTARVRILGHQVAEGEVAFISSLADPSTRTFRVEIEIPNPDRKLPAGTSAETEIPVEQVMAHLVSPALVSLDDEGRVGVKTVNDQGLVEFHPATVVRAQRDGLWVTGLPEQADIITVGQGFVSAGEPVQVQEETKVADDRSAIEGTAEAIPDESESGQNAANNPREGRL